MQFKKIIIFLIILSMLVAPTFAVEIDDMKIPMEFSEKKADGVWVVPSLTGTADEDPMFTVEPKDSGKSSWEAYDIEWNDENIGTINTPYDGCVGCVELVEIDGEQYVISMTYDGTGNIKGELGAAYSYLEDFNKDNNANILEWDS